MSIIRTEDRSFNAAENRFTFRASSILRPWPNAPVFVVANTATSNTNSSVATTVTWPTGVAPGDFAVLVVESSTNTTPTPSGWTLVTGSTVAATGTILSVLYTFADASSAGSSFTVGPLGNHELCRMYIFRNVSRRNPIQATATSVKNTASTTTTYPNLTTVTPNALVLLVATRDNDDSGTIAFGTISGTNLTGLTEQGEAGTLNGDGGGFVLSSGVLAAPGSVGTGTSTQANSTRNACMTLALTPSLTVPA